MSDFEVGTKPVSVEQYLGFVLHPQGYRNPQWWSESDFKLFNGDQRHWPATWTMQVCSLLEILGHSSIAASASMAQAALHWLVTYDGVRSLVDHCTTPLPVLPAALFWFVQIPASDWADAAPYKLSPAPKGLPESLAS